MDEAGTGLTYSTSSSAWTLAIPCTRAIPSLSSSSQRRDSQCHPDSIPIIPLAPDPGIDIRAVGVLGSTCCLPPSLGVEQRTRQRGRGQSRRGQPPPGHRGFSAREWTRPRSARPWLRRMCGFGGPRRWVRHFAVGEPVSLAEKRATRQKRKIEQLPVQAPGARPPVVRRRKRAQLSFPGACRAD
jgi:hypothetical protein